jgi:hypothetical protein
MEICPGFFLQLLGNSALSPTGGRLISRIFHHPSLFSEVLHFCLHLYKVKEEVEKFENHQRLLS